MKGERKDRNASGVYFEVWRGDAWTKLNRRYDDPEKALRAAKRHKMRYGYQEPYIVVRVKWSREYTDDGRFVAQRNEACAVYGMEV